ncbi:MAG TPA: lysylphosphatidylglycerol synthase transmembrane domain-containing protein [Thermoanaerobaculia bacterium]|nr:lysylphosphatidylglycerol synthase transmembrane domain-containing protein [Thermoanaerobaculia bacterium]
MRRILSWLPGILLLAGLVAVVNHAGEGQRFAEMLEQARPAWLLVGALLQAVTYVCAAAVWQRPLRKGRARCTVRSLVPVAIARLFVDQVVPTAGFGGRLLVVRSLRRRGVHVGLAVAAILVDLLTLYAAFAVAVIASLAIILVFRGDLNHLVLVLAGLFAIFALAIPSTVLWFSRGGVREPPRWLHRLPRADELLKEVARAPRRLVRNRQVLLQAGALQLAIFLIDGATLWAMLRAVGYDADPLGVFASFIFAQVAGTVFLVPGGLGTFEASSVAMLTLFKVPVETALTATLLLRGLTYWLPMAPGYWLSHREIKKKVPAVHAKAA